MAILTEILLKMALTTDFADDNLEFNENGKKFSKRVENIAGKGEIAHHKQFFPFPSVFKRLAAQGGHTCY